MFSGKTSLLISNLQRYEIAHKKVLLIKYHQDKRYDELKCSTHNHVAMDAISVSTLTDVSLEQVARADVIGIDEGQFYSDVVECSERWANQGKVVIIACLDGNSQRETFPVICSLIAKCDSLEKIHAVCHFCGKDASFTLSIQVKQDEKKEGEFLPNIGGYENYRATCRSCYNLAHIYDQEETKKLNSN